MGRGRAGVPALLGTLFAGLAQFCYSRRELYGEEYARVSCAVRPDYELPTLDGPSLRHKHATNSQACPHLRVVN